ncbi:Negative regulator of mitosis [Wickerhamiella sorbophila]|uniref:Negative regulator of mitosis n=1 Tax=Wickerhamiella sorbophila TaxID=45607 RepID=A0A2T0FPN1_9ASCO|nr:Negative regulator of mitosis [Wickerhamiella sorbophila]PRT56950.1 Negative regulator of mitosis [Wickerhamiella sorbophila]
MLPDPNLRAGALVMETSETLFEGRQIHVDKSVCTIKNAGREIARIEVEEKSIDHALFVYFGGVKTLVVIAGDMLYSLGRGARRCTMTLPFTPINALVCEKGLILASKTALYLMTDPLKVLGLVVPSSTSTIGPDEQPIYFGDEKCHLAVFKDKDSIKIYHIRYLARQRKRGQMKSRSKSRTSFDQILSSSGSLKRSSSARLSEKALRLRRSDRFSDRISDRLSLAVLTDESSPVDIAFEDFEYEKEALLSFVNSVSVSGSALLRVHPQRLQSWLSLSILDYMNSILIHSIYSRGNILESTELLPRKSVVPLVGYKIKNQDYPFLAFLTEGYVMICSPFFKGQTHKPPLQNQGSISDLQPLGLKNGFKYKSNGSEWENFQLVEFLHPLIVQCFELLTLSTEPEILSHLVLNFALNSRVLDQWEVFESVIVSCLANFSDMPSQPWLALAQRVQKTSTKTLTGPDTIIYLHLLREDMMLRARASDSVRKLGHLLSCLTTWAGWSWSEYYRVDANSKDLEESVNLDLAQVPGRLPVIYESFVSNIQPPFIPYPDTSQAKDVFYYTNVCKSFFEMLSAQNTTVSKMLQLLKTIDLTPSKLETFAVGPRFCIMEVLGYMQIEAGEAEFRLLNRRDLEATYESTQVKVAETSQLHDDDHLNITRLIFDKDRRFYEVAHLLQVNKSQQCDLLQPPDCSEHDWLEMQQNLAHLVAIRTLSASFGLAAVYFSSKVPIVSERLELSKLDFDIFLRDHGVSIVFSPENLSSSTRTWGYLAHGVATGLSISKEAKNITSHWIVYNNSQENTYPSQHAGFLLGLGIMGHLKTLEEWHIYHYLGEKDPIMSNALLMGLAASSIGTMNSKLTKVLSVHISALLPLGSSDLNVTPSIQTAAIIAMGLLYMETQNRRMSEVMLSELCSTSTDRLEMYRTASGISLGLMNLGKGKDLCGFFDVEVVEELQAAAAIQSDARPLSPVQLSQSGSVMALMLMFLGTNDAAVASSLNCPTSEFLANYTRPDILYTRSMARNLVLFDSIQPSREWITKQIPPAIYVDLSEIQYHDSDFLPFYNILCGVLVSIGIKFAGTGDESAIDVLLHYVDEFRRLSQLPVTSVDERICKFGLTSLQSRLVISVSLVAAGRGTVSVLQRLRPLFAPITPDTTYDEYVGVSMAMGILFLGGGQYSFSRSPRSIGCLAISLMSLAGAETEAAGWEHLRFFWAFATEKRCLIVRDVETHVPLQVNVEIVDRSGGSNMLASPCLLPPLDTIADIAIKDKMLLPITIHLSDPNNDLAHNVMKTKTIFMQKAKTVSSSLADRLAWRSSPQGSESMGNFLDILASQKNKRPETLWNLKLLLVFAESWRPDEELRCIPRRRLDKVKVHLRRTAGAKSNLFNRKSGV